MPRMPLDGMEDKYRCYKCNRRGMRYQRFGIVCINNRCDNFKHGVRRTGSQ
jgi:hypothetical protein